MLCNLLLFVQLKNLKNAHGGVLILVKLQALVSVFNLIKIYTPPWIFLGFLNFANGIQSRNASHIYEHSDSEKDIAGV